MEQLPACICIAVDMQPPHCLTGGCRVSLKSDLVSAIVIAVLVTGTLFISPEGSASPPSDPTSPGENSAQSDSFDSTEAATSRGSWSEPESPEIHDEAGELNFSEIGKWLSVQGEELS